MCALKRPFDDQSDNRIWIETEAVIRILELCHLQEIGIVNSAALVIENNQNPKPIRRSRVAAVIAAFGEPVPLTARILNRAENVRALGFKDMDALHIAFAEFTRSDYLVTCDDRLCAKSARVAERIAARVTDPLQFLKEYRE